MQQYTIKISQHCISAGAVNRIPKKYFMLAQKRDLLVDDRIYECRSPRTSHRSQNTTILNNLNEYSIKEPYLIGAIG